MIFKFIKGKSTLLLVSVVIFIWSVLLFRLTKASTSTKELVVNKEIQVANITIEPQTRYTLSSYDRDPFLGTAKLKKKKQNRKVISKVHWPQIEYLGRVNSSIKNERFHFFKVNGKTKIWAVNETYKEMKMIELKKGVRLTYKGEHKKFNTQE